MNQHIYKYIIIGAGITGLYFAYNLEKKKIKDYLIIEKNDHIGGRISVTKFHGADINLGAGIVGKHNKNLIRLCEELNIKLNSYYSDYELLFKSADKEWFNKKVKELYKIFKADKHFKDVPFIVFLHNNLPESERTKYISHMEFIDYLDASTKQTFDHYPVEDMYLGNELYYNIKWNVLVDKLLEYVKNIKLENQVEEIEFKDNVYKIKTTKGIYYASKIIFATDINIKKIKIKGFSLPKFLDLIDSIEYIRMYTRHDKHDIPQHLIGDNYLRRIIPVDKNVIMSAYSEFEFANKLNKTVNESKDKIATINKLIKQSLNNKYHASPIKKESDYKIAYWKHGVHYFKPGYVYDKNYYVNDQQNMIIIGEVITATHGYVNSGIHSVDDLIENYDVSP
ncbi:MAG: amino oxidase [Edafosvirus sp.]|uniref:Amino oxidase n=1 Tax=Edafosvirus sp. TaxID=2487765 RepID=A0A3G4ZVT1_9VIRU|nr:MAG: amino oxidase [Edafosvirus sp.]